jgi:hypothetical protein
MNYCKDKYQIKYCVYIHINKINKHFYIGITSINPTQRFGKNGQGYKQCTHFYYAIQKYGWENFKHIILLKNLNKKWACRLEILLIKLSKTLLPKFCYNITFGGDLGRHGLIVTQEYREKFVGENNPVSRYVICVTTGKIFGSASLAAKHYNVIRRNVTRACQTGIAAGEYNGEKLYWAYYDNDTETYKFKKRNNKIKRVKCITTGKIFESIKEAAKYYDVNPNGISLCCKGKQENTLMKTKEKLQWEYYKEVANA